jgi:hypothetical protein
LQNPNKINGDNLNIRGETRKNSRDKKRNYLKEESNEFEKSSKNKNNRDLCRRTNVHKYGNNLVDDENDSLLADINNILNR